jgi:hypothetical protein
MAKAISVFFTLSNGDASGGRWGRGFECQLDHRRLPMAATIKREDGVRTGWQD